MSAATNVRSILARFFSFDGEGRFGLFGKQIMDGAREDGRIAAFDDGIRLLGQPFSI